MRSVFGRLQADHSEKQTSNIQGLYKNGYKLTVGLGLYKRDCNLMVGLVLYKRGCILIVGLGLYKRGQKLTVD